MTKQTEQKWRDRVREWRASGQTAEEFAREKSYESSTLRWWSARLGKADAVAQAPRIVPVITRGPVMSGSGAVMVRATMPAAVATQSEVVVEIGAARVRVARGFDDALLARVVRALAAEAG